MINNGTGSERIQPILFARGHEPMVTNMRMILLSLIVFGLTVTAQAQDNVRHTPVVRVVKECSSSVVNIGTERIILLRQNPFWGNYGERFDDAFEDFFRPSYGTLKQKSLGSGVEVSSDGLIVTNAHVIHMANKIYVTLSNGQIYEAVQIGIDNVNDLALIKIEPKEPLNAVQFADDVITGETVVAIGNPFGLENSVSAGVVSGTNRTTYLPQTNHLLSELIQTDASINPGSSGGALLNLEGKLVGINLAVVQNANNIGFVVPAKKVKDMMQEYERFKNRVNQTRKVLDVPVQ